jgi:hypothetical protein
MKRDELEKKMFKLFEQMLDIYDYADVIDVSPKQRQKDLNLSFLEDKAFLDYLERRNIILRVKHHRHNNKMLAVITPEYSLKDTGLRMCAQKQQDNTYTPGRHKDHSNLVSCLAIDPKDWDIKPEPKTTSPVINKSPSEASTEVYRGIARVPQLPIPKHLASVTLPNKLLMRAIIDDNNCLYSLEDDQLIYMCPNNKEAVVKWWYRTRKKLPAWQQRRDFQREYIEHLNPDDTPTKGWVNRKEKQVYDSYGMPIYPYRKLPNYTQKVLTRFMAYNRAKAIENRAKSNYNPKHQN